jgi:RHS repeat-associated protein
VLREPGGTQTTAVALWRTLGTGQPFGYMGAVFDPAFQFHYLRARWYGPKSGRFLERASLFGTATVPGSLHRYAYAHHNPLAYQDPTGHFITPFPAILDPWWNEPQPPGYPGPVRGNLWPDYVSFQFGVSPILGLAGPYINLTADRFANTYWGVGGQLARGPIAGLSLTGGWLLQPTIPAPDTLNSFLTGWGVSFGGGFVLGASLQASAGGFAPNVGIFTPQIGPTAGWSWQLPLSWQLPWYEYYEYGRP